MFHNLYLDTEYSIVRIEYNNPFIISTMTNPNTGGTYRIRFLSPLPTPQIVKTKQLIKHNQKMIHIKKIIDTKIKPFIKSQHITNIYSALQEIPYDIEPYFIYGRLRFSHKVILLNIAIAIFSEISRYLNQFPTLPLMSLYQYSIEEHKVELGFLLDKVNIYTKYIFDTEKLYFLQELDYRDIYLLNSDTVQDLFIISYYYFYFWLKYGIEFFNIELVENNQNLRVMFGGYKYVGLQGIYKKYGQTILSIFNKYYKKGLG